MCQFFVIPVGYPLPHISNHVETTIRGSARRKRANGRSVVKSIIIALHCPRNAPIMLLSSFICNVRHLPHFAIAAAPPRILAAVRPTGRFFPFCLSWQSLPCPFAIRLSLVHIYTIDRMVLTPAHLPITNFRRNRCTAPPSVHTLLIGCHRHFGLVDLERVHVKLPARLLIVVTLLIYLFVTASEELPRGYRDHLALAVVLPCFRTLPCHFVAVSFFFSLTFCCYFCSPVVFFSLAMRFFFTSRVFVGFSLSFSGCVLAFAFLSPLPVFQNVSLLLPIQLCLYGGTVFAFDC